MHMAIAVLVHFLDISDEIHPGFAAIVEPAVNDSRVKELAKILAVLDARGALDLIFRALQVSGR